MSALLVRIGLVRREIDGRIVYPFHVAPHWRWQHPILSAQVSGWFYVFHNLPGVVKWEKGRMLPRRWGFGIMGLIEFGDRG